jgi:chromosome partitioning protein
MVAAINEVAKEYGGERPKLEAIVPCRVHPRRNIHWVILDKLEKDYPGKIAPSIRENVSVAESPFYGKSVLNYAPSSHGAEDYRAVTEWLVKQDR